MFVFYFFALILIWLGIQSLRGGFRFLAYVKKELAKPQSNYTPFVSVFAPCRGLDEDLRKNFTALFQFDYSTYEVIFVVDSEDDKAVPIIRDVSRGKNSKLVVAGKATESGQKVHNLRRVVLEASPESAVFAFVDSDARPQENWLKNLVAPLEDEAVGAATGYRWFISKKRNFGSELRSVWNASIASALGENSHKNFCWGGATAIRREVFEQINMRENWRGTLSDDFALMRTLREHRLPIHFVPQCLTASIEDCTLAECLEFTTRQLKITRVYAPHFWKASLIGGIIFTGTFFTGVLMAIYQAVSGFFGFSFWLTLGFVVLICLLGTVKAWLRLQALKLVLTKYERELSNSTLSQLTLWTITPPLYVYNGLCAAFSRKIRWRGIEYYLTSPNETMILSESKGGSLTSSVESIRTR